MSFLKRKKKEEEEQAAPQEESVESILNEIKNIVSGGSEVESAASAEEDDVLELTEIVDNREEKPVEFTVDEERIISESNDNSFTEQSEEEKFVDVLAEIDSSLSDEEEKTPDFSEDNERKIREDDILSQLEKEVKEPEVQESFIQQPDEILTEVVEEIQEVVAPVAEAVKLTESPKVEIPKAKIQEEIMAEETPKVKEALVSKDKADKSSQAIKTLMDNIPRPKVESPEFRAGFTVEDLVSESLRPMLKQWLDNNLEIIVRDVVEREIRKIIPREE